MRKNKKTSIRTETKEVLIITQAGSSKRFSWCGKCFSDVRWLTFGEAAKLNQLSAGKLSSLLDTGRVHCSEMAQGHILFCLNSLNFESTFTPTCDQGVGGVNTGTNHSSHTGECSSPVERIKVEGEMK